MLSISSLTILCTDDAKQPAAGSLNEAVSREPLHRRDYGFKAAFRYDLKHALI